MIKYVIKYLHVYNIQIVMALLNYDSHLNKKQRFNSIVCFRIKLKSKTIHGTCTHLTCFFFLLWIFHAFQIYSKWIAKIEFHLKFCYIEPLNKNSVLKHLLLYSIIYEENSFEPFTRSMKRFIFRDNGVMYVKGSI